MVGVALQRGQGLQIASIGQLVEVDQYLIRQFEPVQRKVATNKAGSAGYKNTHFFSSIKLTCAKARQHGLDRLEHYQEVQPEREIFDVVKVVLDLDLGFVGVSGVAMHGLRPAGNTRLDDVTVVVERDLFFKLVHKHLLLRTRANQSHFTPNDVEKLGELVDPGLADEFADTRDAHITGLGELGAILLGVATHTAKLEDGEFLAKLADAFLQEQHGAIAFQFNDDAGDDHDGQDDRHGKQHQRGFPDALEDAVGFRRQ